MKIIFCDNHLLVVLKPAGLSTQPHTEGKDNLRDRLKITAPLLEGKIDSSIDDFSSQRCGGTSASEKSSKSEPFSSSISGACIFRRSLTDQAKAWVKREFNKPGQVFLEPVHRLDKPVSGLVLFARTSKALSRLQEQMRQYQIEKTYFALVEGALSERDAVLEHFLVHEEHKARVVTFSHKEGKLARLHYTVLSEKKGKSLLSINLLTGRYHQIRIQLATMGFPIIGDSKYGSTVRFESNAICLHHGWLKLTHPVTQESLLFESPVAFSGF